MKRKLCNLWLAIVLLSLFAVPSSYAAIINDGTYFFSNDEGKFWLRGEPYGSAVQLYDWGLPVNVTTTDGISTLKFGDASDWKIFDDGSGVYADNASHDNSTWVITKRGDKYIFKNNVSNRYIKVEGTRLLTTATEGEAYAFTLASASDHQTAVNDFVNNQASTAATSAGLSATSPSDLAKKVIAWDATCIISGSTPTSTAEKYQGGQWDNRTIYSGNVNITTAGLYKFTIQAYNRMTDNDATYALHSAQADCPPVYVFFGDAKTPIKSVMSEAATSAYSTQDYENNGNHYPDGQTSAKEAFVAGRYVNTVWVYISSPGNYSYGIQNLGWTGSHSSWTCYTTQSVSITRYSEAGWNGDAVENVISGWECTTNDAWSGSGRTTVTGTYYDWTNRTYFTQNHENGAARSQIVTIPTAGTYLLRTMVRPLADESFATISVGDISTTTRGIPSSSANIGNGWTYNDVYFTTSTSNESKTISIALSNVNNSREADCGEMHLYYLGSKADFVMNGVHKYVGTYDTAPALEVTDAEPVVDITNATFTSGTSTVTFTNPNGLVFVKTDGQTSAAKNEVVGTTCTSLQLTDGHPFVNPTAFTATSATYTLSALAGGEFATLMLPFTATTLSGSAYTLDQGVDLMDGNIRGTAVSSIAANTPVIVTASGNYTGSNVTVPVIAQGATYTNGELVGVYSPTAAPTSSYVLQNHTAGEGVAFYLVGSTKPTVNPFRAYIKAQSNNVRALQFQSEGDTDGIHFVDNEETKNVIFNLAGQRISKPQRGVYVVNGKKVIIK